MLEPLLKLVRPALTGSQKKTFFLGWIFLPAQKELDSKLDMWDYLDIEPDRFRNFSFLETFFSLSNIDAQVGAFSK